MINIFTFENADGEAVQIACHEVSDATARARESLEQKKFRLVGTERRPDWDDFAEQFNPQVMLQREVEDEDIPGLFFIGIAEFQTIKGFHELAKHRHVWTVCDYGDLQWIVPGFRFVNRSAYIVTKTPHKENTPDFVYAS